MRSVTPKVWAGWSTTSRLLSLAEKRLPGNEIFYKDTKAVMESPSCSCPWCSCALLNSRRGRQGTRLLWMQWNSGSCKSRLNKHLSGMTWLQLVVPWGQLNGLGLFLGVPVKLDFSAVSVTQVLCIQVLTSLPCQLSWESCYCSGTGHEFLLSWLLTSFNWSSLSLPGTELTKYTVWVFMSLNIINYFFFI